MHVETFECIVSIHPFILVKVRMRDRVCVTSRRLLCDPGTHVQPIRANQRAVIRVWLRQGGSVAVGEFKTHD